jgi:hypothetical protein
MTSEHEAENNTVQVLLHPVKHEMVGVRNDSFFNIDADGLQYFAYFLKSEIMS